MPRKYPTKNYDVLGKPDVEPAKLVGEYFTSRDNNKIFLKPPGTLGEENEIVYLDARLQNESMTKVFHELLQRRKLLKTLATQRIRKVSKDQAKLLTRLIAVNTFIREFNTKKKIAQRKIHNEKIMQKKICDEMNIKLERYNDLKDFRKKLIATANEYKVYEEVLEKAVKQTKCHSVGALIDKCDAIMLAQGHIIELDTKMFKEIESMRKRIVVITKHAETIYKGLINELKQMSRSYHIAKNECMRWENVLSKAKEAIIEKNTKNVSSRSALYEIYRLLCAKRKIIPTLARVELPKILDFIKNEIEVLREIVQEYHNPMIMKIK